MKTPPALAAKVITTHGLNALAAYDQAERLRLFYAEGDPDELVAHLNDLVRDLDGTFLVKAWLRGNPKGGRPPARGETYSWLLSGRKEPAEQVMQGTVNGAPQQLLDELAQLRAEKMMRDQLAAQDADDDDDDEDEQPDHMAQLVGLITNLLLPKPAAAAAEPVAGAERGHPSALAGERLERIVAAIRNLHGQDPSTFTQYEAALLQTYGRTA